ncbi:hypothetical protein IFM89_000907 [Coptis chinensis]|uniref:Leucine-rich repeat-containing N-terminal plant-type domain-containing protein n=1 Tax=Coptis chinensis TaxID=261450 RepID=A0A835IL53_9MAGN|nr:hypothetical protein IFM89_000907 [Coptis chinensis]
MKMSLISALYFFIFFNILFTSFSILDPTDFLALQAIRKSLTDMPGSKFFTSWDFTSDPCSFTGVNCDSNSNRVIALNLGDSTAGSPGLEGRLHPSLGKLSSLTELTLVPGRVMGALPLTISNLHHLKFLAISNNFISGPIPKSFSNLKMIQTLDLSYNQLTGSIPGPFNKLSSLNNLILCHNHLTGSIPSFFSSKTLLRIDLKHNNLSGSLLHSSSLPSSLQYLSLSSNQFSGPVNRVLMQLNRLNYLDLSQNRFTGPIPDSVFSYPLVNLQLQRNFFSGPVRPLNRVGIKTVDLSYNRLTGQISSMLSSVQNLYLNNNRFIGQVPGSFVERLLDEGIEVLYLQHNYLTGIEINPTAEIPMSSTLCLQYNCMVPPMQAPCPLRAGKQRTRPAEQCIKWKHKNGGNGQN